MLASGVLTRVMRLGTSHACVHGTSHACLPLYVPSPLTRLARQREAHRFMLAIGFLLLLLLLLQPSPAPPPRDPGAIAAHFCDQ